MSLSFARIGFWKLVGLGIIAEVLHLAFQHRWPELSPHYSGARPAWAKFFLISEYCFLMASLIAAAGTIESAVRTHDWKATTPYAVIVAWLAYFALFLWVLR